MAARRAIVVGFGMVGQANAIALLKLGYDVSYYDIVSPRLHFVEEWADCYERILSVTNSCELDDENVVYVVCVSDEIDAHGKQDISFIKRALCQLNSVVGTVLLRSTVLPHNLSQLKFDFYVPDFLRGRTAISDSLNPEICIIGTNGNSPFPEFLRVIYQNAQKKYLGTPEEAAFIKYISNIWNASRIAFVNEVGATIEASGIVDANSVDRLIDVVFSKADYLMYGMPFGGRCLPKDSLAFLSWCRERGYPSTLLGATVTSNSEHEKRCGIVT